MNMTRREALKLGLVGSGALLSPFGFPAIALAQSSPQIPRFQQPFQTPPVLKPVRSDDTFDYYEITMQKQSVNVLPNRPATEVWSYNGSLPGPIMRQPKRRQSVVRFINQLGSSIENGQEIPLKTSVHLHGMASLPQYDGYAEDLTPPGYYKDYYYPNNRAATLWYHDHAVRRTSRHVYMGLASMYIVDYAPEDLCNPADLDLLPQGDYEIPLIIQDKRFDTDGQLVFDDRGQRGIYEDVILVNGVPFPQMDVARRKYRFRVLNASASRTFELAFSREEKTLTKGDSFTIVASDAGLLSMPVTLEAPYKTLRIGVAERYEFVIDFANYSPETKYVYLRNLGYINNLDSEPQALMRFNLTGDRPSDNPPLPTKLGKVTPLQSLLSQVSRTRTLRFERNGGDWKINNRTWDKDFVAADPGLCDVEIWNLVNTGGWTHPVHIHLVDLQLISRNGLPPAPYERGWKDVFVLNDFETVRVIAKFGPHTGKYMMHCHNIVHEDHDMMTQFEVGKGGPSPTSAPAKPLPTPQIGSTPTPSLISTTDFPSKCFIPAPDGCT
jgi:FtsP/CotA-like multicopper oxidase with cupredoxin domain